MRIALAPLAVMALLPAMLGPLPANSREMQVPLCSGGTAAVPTAPGNTPGPQQGPCCAKGCQSSSRKRIDRTQ